MSFFQPNPNFLQLFADLDVSLEDGAWLLQKKKAFDDKQISRAREIRMNREERLKYFVRLETGESEEYAAAEALQDKYILFKGPGHISIGQIKAARDWLGGRDMLGNTKYITQILSRILGSQLAESERNRITQEVYDGRLLNYYYDPPPSPRLGASHGQQAVANLVYLQDLCENSRWSPPSMPGGNDNTWNVVKEYFALLTHLSLMLRWTDTRNPFMFGKQLPDGSNLGPDLRASWVLHRAWIRLLHYRSLYVGEHNYGYEQLQHIYALSHAALKIERMKTRVTVPQGSATDRSILAHFLELSTLYTSIENMLIEFVATMLEERRPVAVWELQYRSYETLQYNLSACGQLAETLSRLAAKHLLGSESTALFYNNLRAEEKFFEETLQLEHVEDVLINKRVCVRDEPYELNQVLTLDYDPGWDPLSTEYNLLEENVVYKTVQKIGEINRHRRNFKLLRDWSKKRPWDQIFKVYPTSQDPELKRLIKQFWSKIDFLTSQDIDPENPSRPSNIWRGLWPIHPLDPEELPEDIKKISDGGNWDTGCLCGDQFIDVTDRTIFRLHCGHYICNTCARASWDHMGNYTHPCPWCRQEWLLHEQAGIQPECLDIWDNQDVIKNAGAKYRDEKRNIPDFTTLGSYYWNSERDSFASSVEWLHRDFRGGDNKFAVRNLRIEMTRMRDHRRWRNDRRRAAVINNVVPPILPPLPRVFFP